MAYAYDAVTDKLTIEEFLGWDDGSGRRHELFDGRVVAMAPPSEPHGLIVGQMHVALAQRLTPPCRAVISHGIRADAMDESFFEADIGVTRQPTEAGRVQALAPKLVVEVLSPSTRYRDLGFKLERYQQLASIDCIILIDAATEHVRVHGRIENGWEMRDYRQGEATVPGFGFTIPLSEIYGTVLTEIRASSA